MSRAATIRSKFVTAEETARILGVPASRAQEIIALVSSNGHTRAHSGGRADRTVRIVLKARHSSTAAPRKKSARGRTSAKAR